MALIKQIKARLKVLYPGVNLSNKRIEAIALKVDAKVSEEEEIDDVLSTFNDFYAFADMAKDDDRERLRLKKEPESTEGKTPEQIAEEEATAKAGNNDPEMPAWAKALVTSTQALAEGLQVIQGEKVTNVRKQQYEKALEGTSDAFKAKALKDFSKMKFDTDEEFNEFLTESETDAADFIQEVSNNGLTNQAPLRAVKNVPGQVKLASDAELDAVMENL